MQEAGRLNLNPGFQRKSVWRQSDRQKLITSIFDGMPVPSIFLYRRSERGRPVYDVLDGKQRIESIFMFMRAKGFTRDGFDVKYQFPEDDGMYRYEWRDIKEWGHEAVFRGYEMQAVEVEGDMSAIVDLFVRINSTGQKLTRQEQRHAQFLQSPLLKEAQRLAVRHGEALQHMGVVSEPQRKRMRDVELVSELLVAIIQQGPQHKKAALDRAMANSGFTAKQIKQAASELGQAVRTAERILPDMKATRFKQVSDFYSLVIVLDELHRRHLSTRSAKRCGQAASILKRLAMRLDELAERQRNLQMPRNVDPELSAYFMSTREGADALANRKKRHKILSDLLENVFEEKDTVRAFNPVQRRLIWNSAKAPVCVGCKEEVTWDNYHADHVKPHSRGGRTGVENGQVLCARCNTSKGNRAAPKRGRPVRR